MKSINYIYKYYYTSLFDGRYSTGGFHIVYDDDSFHVTDDMTFPNFIQIKNDKVDYYINFDNVAKYDISQEYEKYISIYFKNTSKIIIDFESDIDIREFKLNMINKYT